jgi:hypothetical protein
MRRAHSYFSAISIFTLAIASTLPAAADEPAPAPAPAPAAAVAPPPPVSAQASVSTSQVAAPQVSGDDLKTSTVPWILTGLGGAGIVTGIVLLAAAPSLPASCDEDTRTCARLPGQTDESFSDDQSTAGRARQMPIFGGILLLSGAFLAATGLGMYFYYKPSADKSSRATITPYATPGGGGLSALATF